jgi:Transcription factor WhiB
VQSPAPEMDPDAWYPVARGQRARIQAAQAIAVCNQCPVRLACLEMSMRQWATGGQHGIWGGLLEPERVTVYTAWRAGTPITGLPAQDAAGHSFLNRQVALDARLADRREGLAPNRSSRCRQSMHPQAKRRGRLMAGVSDAEVLLLWRALRAIRSCRNNHAARATARPAANARPRWNGQPDDWAASLEETFGETERHRASWPCSRLLDLLPPS